MLKRTIVPNSDATSATRCYEFEQTYDRPLPDDQPELQDFLSNPHEQEQFVKRYRKRCPSFIDAEDLVQDAYVTILKNKDFEFRSMDQTRAFVAKAIEWQFLARLRAPRREHPSENGFCVADLDQCSPLDQLLEVELASRIRASLDELPPKQAEAIRQRILCNVKFKELGNVLGTTRESARHSYRRGLSALRKLLIEVVTDQ